MTMQPYDNFDIIVNGGGMIGLALVCGLEGTDLQIAVVEPNFLTIKSSNKSALRVSAINDASQQLLRYLQVWDSTIMQYSNKYQSMEIWEKDSFGKIIFNSAQVGYSQLGYIVENSVIQQALWKRANQLDNVELITSASFQHVNFNKHQVCIMLDDGRFLSAKLVVAADGANSWLRKYVNIPLIFWDYNHNALVTNVHTELPHDNIVRQVFHNDGILAFLPLKNPHCSSIVWSLPPYLAKKYQIKSEKYFNAKLAITLDFKLGQCNILEKCHSLFLRARYSRKFAINRLVLLGDAAHTIHPLAGQGVNLGFMDVAMLIEELKKIKNIEKDIGCYSYLKHYERCRQYRALLTLVSMQCFRSLFDGDRLFKKLFRNIGLRLTNIMPDVKSYFIHQAMGIDDMPEWLKSKYFN